MSDERKKAKQQKRPAPQRKLFDRTTIILIVVVAAGIAVALGIKYRRDHRYDAFAKCLTERNVKMYGAYWCPHCTDQKALFGASFKYAPYVECGVTGNTRTEADVCKDAGIKRFPTWQFPPTGDRVEGDLSLEALSDRTGCPLP
jgi:glutaredoxin